MAAALPTPPQEAVFYQDDRLYACLASHPLSDGHCLVVWKAPAADLNMLAMEDYEYLMDKVDEVREALLKTLGVEKVYLLYMEEAHQVHWHLVPRFEEKGMTVLQHQPSELTDFSLAEQLGAAMEAPSSTDS